MEAKKATAQRGRVRVERGIYRQANGKYAVYFRLAGRPRFRTIDGDVESARRERDALVAAAQAGALSVSPQLRFATVAGRWLARFEARVAAGERRERTLEAHRYHLDKHLLPALGRRLMRTITVDDVAALMTALRGNGRSEKTTAGALATLHSVVRFALRNRRIVDDPVSRLEADERPHPLRRRQRVLGRDEIQRLLAASLPRYRPLIATALYSGLRISDRNAERRAIARAARVAGLEDGAWPRLRFHDLRHTFASHLILDLGLDVVQVSRIFGHASVTTTLDVYAHLFEEARHAAEIRERMAASALAQLLTAPPAGADGNVVALRAGAR
jgi:integrase